MFFYDPFFTFFDFGNSDDGILIKISSAHPRLNNGTLKCPIQIMGGRSLEKAIDDTGQNRPTKNHTRQKKTKPGQQFVINTFALFFLIL